MIDKLIKASAVSVLLIASCSPKKSDTNSKTELSLEVIDSIQVDFLGELRLQDYDANLDQYLLVNDMSQAYLEVSGDGKVVQNKVLSPEGLDRISMVMGISYVDGKVIVLTPDQGYVKFENGERVGEVSVPYPYTSFIFYPKLGFHEQDGKAIYPYLLPENMPMSFDSPDFYLSIYKKPMIQIQDLASPDTVGTMFLPETSPLLDGKVHGFPIPVVTKNGKEWLLGMWLEPRFYVYREEGGKLNYQHTVELPIPNWAGYSPVEPAQAGSFFDQMQSFRSASLEDILVMDEYILAIYKKGISKEKYATMDSTTPEGRLNIQKNDPYYVAVFSKEYELIRADLRLPHGVHGPTVINKKGELVTSKNPSLSEVEDKGVILYRMKLVKK
ncbi:hypothetical protein [Algoriphagus mannitolivorans]|uniref:hypothetical protein n=1 Tax=Algoriphagus mannitolivorans TaxID=226504 RepID=UPI0004035DD6|nr:hypothetical protein [Algoriphagus mannitolivorans]